MTFIDVNTGKFTGTNNLEDTILQTNLEAAEEIVIQLRLRNIGGLIVIDFIDMFSGANRKKLSRFFEKTLKAQDRFQSVTLKVSEFGLVQMTRKRSGKTLVKQLTNPCKTCESYGFVKSASSMSFEVLRKIRQKIQTRSIRKSIILSVSVEVFEYLLKHEHRSLLTLEDELGGRIILEESLSYEESRFSFRQPPAK